MGSFRADAFQSLVHDFLNESKTWDDVHNFVIGAEWTGDDYLPTNVTEEYRGALEELRMSFLADSKDDPQFLLSKTEVKALLDKLEAARRR